MKRIVYSFFAALGLIGLAAAADYLFFAEGFGLWTYTLGTIIGLVLGFVGLLISIGKLLFSRRKGPGLVLGGTLFLISGFAFLLALLIWLLAGKPTAL